MLTLLTLIACSGPDQDTTDTAPAIGEMSLDALLPEARAVDVPLDTSIIAEFDRELRSGDIGVEGLRSVSGIDGNTITAQLAEPLDLLTTYTLATFNVVGTDGAVFGNIQTTFTSLDGSWSATAAITEPSTPVVFASTVLGESVVVLSARGDRIEAHSMTALDQRQTLTMDDAADPSLPFVAANDSEAIALWLQDERLYRATGTADGEWSLPEPVTDTSFLIEPTSLAITEDGNAAIGWRSSSVSTRVVTRVDGTWSQPVTLGCATASECTTVSLFADHTGGFTALVRGVSADGKHIESSRFRDGAWTETDLLFTVDGDIDEPVWVARDNETLALWRVSNSPDAGLYMSRRQLDDTWSDVTQVREGNTITFLDVVSMANGGWATTWVEDESTAEDALFSVWVSGVEEEALTDPFRLLESTNPLAGLSLVSDNGGNLHLTWTEQSQPTRLLTRRFNHASGWEAAVELATSASTAQPHSLPSNRANAVFAVDDQLTTVFFE